MVEPVRNPSRAGAFIRGRPPRRNRSIHDMGTSVPSRPSGRCGHRAIKCKDDRVSDFDVLILGAGSGGYSCALRAAQLGLKVGLVEKENLGGTCLHIGCIPTKALLHAAEVADSTRESEQFGVQASLDGIDMAGVNAYKDGVVERLFKGLTGLIKGRGITVIEGAGRLTGPREVTVDGTAYSAEHVVLASGSYPKTLPGLDIDGQRILTSDEALRLDRVPASVVVLGGGVIGCEFASVWRSFGAEVTIVEALPRLVPLEDEASSKVLERAFRKRGIVFKTGTPFQSAKTTDDGVASPSRAATSSRPSCCWSRSAADRRPTGSGTTSRASPWSAASCSPTSGAARTSRTSGRSVTSSPACSSPTAASSRGSSWPRRSPASTPRPIDEPGIPRVTYSHPEVASVGLTEAQAAEEYGADAIEALTYDLGGNGKSQILKTQGFVKLVRRNDGPVVGVHLVGDRVGELIGEAQMIYNWEGYPEDVAPLVHAHPTQNEALGEAHLALAGKPLHAHS